LATPSDNHYTIGAVCSTMWEFKQFKYIEPEDDGIFLIFRGWDTAGIERVIHELTVPSHLRRLPWFLIRFGIP
jgi:hypothetical protein